MHVGRPPFAWIGAKLAFAGACISSSAVWILVALGSPTMLRALLLLALCALAQCYVVGTAPTALRPLARAPAAVTMEEQPFAVFSKIPTPALFATFGGAAMVRARPARK